MLPKNLAYFNFKISYFIMIVQSNVPPLAFSYVNDVFSLCAPFFNRCRWRQN